MVASYFTELPQLLQRQQRPPSPNQIEISFSNHSQYPRCCHTPHDFNVLLIVERAWVMHVFCVDDEVGRYFCHDVFVHGHRDALLCQPIPGPASKVTFFFKLTPRSHQRIRLAIALLPARMLPLLHDARRQPAQYAVRTRHVLPDEGGSLRRRIPSEDDDRTAPSVRLVDDVEVYHLPVLVVRLAVLVVGVDAAANDLSPAGIVHLFPQDFVVVRSVPPVGVECQGRCRR
mmetsp:Transcript_25234/g.60687  ORF Transcript_25234/g.60687 Transcript_25234/m.60687 type:complete len:230 (-) Transcript_25234:216-905(-)